jgi:hypothetical protein
MSSEGQVRKAISFEVDERLIPLPALQQAAHEFALVANINIESKPGGMWRLTISPSQGDALLFEGTFRSRAHDIAQQHRINDQTRTVREALVKAALWESVPK